MVRRILFTKDGDMSLRINEPKNWFDSWLSWVRWAFAVARTNHCGFPVSHRWVGDSEEALHFTQWRLHWWGRGGSLVQGDPSCVLADYVRRPLHWRTPLPIETGGDSKWLRREDGEKEECWLICNRQWMFQVEGWRTMNGRGASWMTLSVSAQKSFRSNLHSIHLKAFVDEQNWMKRSHNADSNHQLWLGN